MLTVIGCILIITGTTGTAWCICYENRERLKLLKNIKYIFEFFMHMIAYQKIPVTEGCAQLAQKVPQPFSEAFERIYQTLTSESGSRLPEIWKIQMEACLRSVRLKEKEKNILLSFPECLGFMDETSQSKALEEGLHEIELCISEQEEEQKNKNKLIMSFGIAGGIFISILLL